MLFQFVFIEYEVIASVASILLIIDFPFSDALYGLCAVEYKEALL